MFMPCSPVPTIEGCGGSVPCTGSARPSAATFRATFTLAGGNAMSSWLRSMGSTSVLLVLAVGLMLTGSSGDKSGSDKKGDDKKGDKGENTKFTKENFDKVKFDMPEKEVINLLGEP